MRPLQVLLICCTLIAPVVCVPQKYKASDGKEYLIETEYKFNWFQAWHECARRDSQLLIIDSAQKNTVIISLLKNVIGKSHNIWLGGNDEFSSSRDFGRPFFWSATGKIFTFNFWSESNPDNYNNKEHCVHIWESKPLYQWNDVDCINKMGFICEENSFLEKYNEIKKLQRDNMTQLFSKLQNIENINMACKMEIQKLQNITQSEVQKILASQEVTAKGLSENILKQVNDLNGELKHSVQRMNANFSERLNASLSVPFKNVVIIRQVG